MARNTGDQQRDQSPRRNAAGTNSAGPSAADRNPPSRNATNRSTTSRSTTGRDAADRNASDRNASDRNADDHAGAARRSDQERLIQANREGTHASTGQSSQTNRSQPSGAMASRRDGSRPYGLSAGGSASPFSAMRRMAEDMEHLFDALGFGRSAFGYSPSLAPLDIAIDRDVWRDASSGQASWSPQAEMFRRGDQVVVRADLPGVKKHDVQVHIDDGVLTISGERRDAHEERRDDFYRTERSYGRFHRSFPLPDGVSGDQCDASFNDGVLEVTLAAPKQQERSRRINVR